MDNVVKVNINNVFASGSTYEVFSAYDSRSLTIRNLTAVNWTRNSFYFQNTTDANVQNLNIKSGKVKPSQVEIRESIIISSHNITIAKSLFSGSASYWTTTDIMWHRAVLEIIDSQVVMKNCSFENNNITPLKLTQTHLTVSGNLNFTNNTAYRGGAMILIHNNTLSLSENSRMTFVGKRAIDTGGAVYIVTSTYIYYYYATYTVCTNCFLNLNDHINSAKQLVFANNSAGQGGDVVYGGRMGYSCPPHYLSCLSKFLEISVINPKPLSPISSDPSRVCFCNKSGVPDCFTTYHPTVFYIYPGQKISISAVAVGKKFGMVAGSVYAQFLYIKQRAQLDLRELAQEVQHIHCNELSYTIFSPVENNHTILILTAVKRSITDIIVTQQIGQSRRERVEDIRIYRYM